MEWQVKHICAFVAAQAPVDASKHGGKNPLVEAADKIDVFSAEKAARDRELDDMRGEKVADDWRDDPRLGRVQADPEAGVEAANPAGSFDAFVNMLSGGARPAMIMDQAVTSDG